MPFSIDSRICLLLGALLLAGPASALPAKHVPVKTARHAKTPAPVPEFQPDPAGLLDQAHAAAAQGQIDLAVRLGQAAVVADPARPSSYDALADIYASSNQPDFARAYYQEALGIDPTDAPAQKGMAALDRSGNQRAARADTGEAKTATP